MYIAQVLIEYHSFEQLSNIKNIVIVLYLWLEKPVEIIAGSVKVHMLLIHCVRYKAYISVYMPALW